LGLNYHLAGAILATRSDGAASIATIGQLQHFMSAKDARELCRRHGLSTRASWIEREFGSYGPEFFAAIGCADLTVMDASAYEGADLVHDLNEPVGKELYERFDVVVDGGSIEHIFRPDQVLANIMRMVRVGGSAIIWTPANNLCGHGFYQLSPEFFFSSLRESTGFRIDTARVVECRYPSVSLAPSRGVYEVRSPREIGDRVRVTSRHPLMLLVRATKLAHLDQPFARTPQQSDYEDQWEAGQAASGRRYTPGDGLPAPVRAAADAVLPRLRRHPIGGAVLRRVLGLAELRRDSLSNRRFFTPVD
jgi:SAM-dependent methyltransferase